MTKIDTYRPRIADKLLARKLKGKGAVLIEGAKWCGKTTTAEQLAHSVLYVSEPGKVGQNIELSRLNPSLLLKGEKPVSWTNGRSRRCFGTLLGLMPTTVLHSDFIS